ncbi:MAG: Gfo/Idh/MocA family oxidoreductase, partial [Candidatus Zixiibacteriota bacterium]
MNPTKTAVIGVGKLGRNHARWYSAIETSDLVGVFDANAERCAEVAGEFSTRAFSSLAEALESAEAVSVATPTTTHYEIALQALECRAHVLIEKPITADVSQARALIEAAGRNSRELAVGHIERFNPAYRALAGMSLRPRFIEAHRLAAFSPRSADVAVI